MTPDAWVADVVQRLQTCLPSGEGPYALHEPRFGPLEREYVLDCLDSGWVSSAGAYVGRFERELADVCGVRSAVACVNGTAALQVALRLVGVRPGDEVLMPALTFVGTANAVATMGAVPHFVDAEERTLGADPVAARQRLASIATSTGGEVRNTETGRTIAAIVVVHVFGHPVDVDGWVALADEFGLPIVEDAAEALGSSVGGRACGAFGRMGVLSFNGNKILTTGGGGALVTDDEELGVRAKHLTTTAKQPHAWEFLHDEVAYNFRMPNLNAALGCGQLASLGDALRRKRELAGRYLDAFQDADGAEVVREREGTEANYWLNALLLTPERAPLRDAVLQATNDQGIMTRPAWTPMHRLPMFVACPRADLPVTDGLVARLVNVPSSPQLVVG